MNKTHLITLLKSNGYKNIENKSLYENDLIKDEPDKLPINHELNDGNNKDGLMGNLSDMPKNNPSTDLIDNNLTAVLQGEAMNGYYFWFDGGLNNISPNFKKDDKANDDLKENPPKNDKEYAAKSDDIKKPKKKVAKR